MRWFTSDQHFSHANIIRYCDRPFSTIQEMNEEIVRRWNAVVASEDEVWVLGDVALNPGKLGPVGSLKGKKYLVAGNHDSCWEGHGKSFAQVERYLDAGFVGVNTSSCISRFALNRKGDRVGGGTEAWVALSHFPYYATPGYEDQDRFASWRLEDKGLPLLCGHVHNAWQTQGKQLNVGVDVWDFYPVSEQTVLDRIRKVDGGS